ncbi:MAG: GTP-binding protein [Synechococcus sp. TMED19]|nr:MAG: GTP-binding protein [Synechococcus sp. TMED19]
MSRTRLWLLLGGVLLLIVVLSLVLQAVNSLIWQLSYWLPGWLVGPALLMVLAVLAMLIYPLLGPMLRSLRRGEQTTPSPEAPSSRQEAAKRNLESIEQQLSQLSDTVARTSLEQRRQEVEASLERGDLVVVVFGSGSSGKTSLIRALLNDQVGQVGAAMGSTQSVQRYRLRLGGLQRAIQLRDTPGILEAGDAGLQREREARNDAVAADLLLFVVDADLRASEFKVLKALGDLGKRTILVLNKCDLRGETEESRLLQLLRRRCEGLVAPQDVLSASGSPQSIPRPGGQPLQPKPEIEALLRRVAQVLREEGEELLADNILLQSRQLADSSQDLLDRQRRAQAVKIVDRYSWIGAGAVAVTPLPGIDLLATAAVNAQMVVEIAQVYGVSISREQGQQLALSLGRTLASLGVVKGGAALMTAALASQLPTLVAGKALQAVTAAWLTRLAGRSFMTYFSQQQDWGDGGMGEVVRRQYDLDRRDLDIKRFLEQALARVVEPLRRGRRLPPQRGPRAAAAAEDRRDQGVSPRPDRPGPEAPRSRR